MDPKIKLLRYHDRVMGAVEGEFKPPIMADVDATNGLCNLDCEWCAQRASQETKPATFMPVETMQRMGAFCAAWGVKSWRLAGDSEPTLNQNIHHLFRSGHEHGISMGLITNGILLDKVQDLQHLTWIGVSLDATTATTWSRLKHSPERNFHRILDNIKRIKDHHPQVEISLKFIRWSNQASQGRTEMASDHAAQASASAVEQRDNFTDSEDLPRLAAALGCKFILRDAILKDCATHYRFDICRATPLYATFGATHQFYLCCDQRTGLMLTDDYRRDDWQELLRLWGSPRHKELVASIKPKNCAYCTKEWLNSILENIVLDGPRSQEYQVDFI